jgi:cytoskeletal protein CcmA (bactofilin family)
MFNQKKENMSKNNGPDSGTVNIIGAGTLIVGDITTGGDIRIDGTLQGTLQVKGRLVLGGSGKIEGEVSCTHADISGAVNGKISVSDLLALKSSAQITGEIVTNKLSIEPGANFSGTCQMAGKTTAATKKEPETKEEKALAY